MLYILMKQGFKGTFIENMQELLKVKKYMIKYQEKSIKEQI